MTADDSLRLVAAKLAAANSVVVLTGAGVSAESGIRTFRGATAADLPADMRALWKEFDPATLATPEAFAADPAGVSKWYDWRRQCCLAAEPNPGHLALAEIERRLASFGGRFTLLTQNVDRLHHKAGSSHIVELHGSIVQWRCTKTHQRLTPPPEPFAEFPPRSPWGGLLRPDVVWFGEMLPPEALDAADEALGSCDLFMSVGTSSVVYPAAAFVDVACANGAFAVEINPDRTPASSRVNVVLTGPAGQILPRLIGE